MKVFSLLIHLYIVNCKIVKIVEQILYIIYILCVKREQDDNDDRKNDREQKEKKNKHRKKKTRHSNICRERNSTKGVKVHLLIFVGVIFYFIMSA